MFHFNDGQQKENTYGWFTLLKNVDSRESYIFEAFVKKRKAKDVILTKAYLLEQVEEFKRFKNELSNLGLSL